MTKKVDKVKLIELDQLRLQKIFEGDDREFSKLYTDCKNLINFYKKKYRGNIKVNVEDAYNEAAYTCYANIKSGKLRLLSAELKDYISRIMSFKLYDEAQKYGIELEIEHLDNEFDINEEDKQLIKKRSIVSNFVSKLKEPCKTIIELFYLEGKSYNDIMKILSGYNSINAIKTQSYKCKSKMTEGLRIELIANDINI